MVKGESVGCGMRYALVGLVGLGLLLGSWLKAERNPSGSPFCSGPRFRLCSFVTVPRRRIFAGGVAVASHEVRLQQPKAMSVEFPNEPIWGSASRFCT